LDLLFENPFIIVVLIGIISSLFNRMKSSAEEPKRQPVRPVQNRPAQAQSTTMEEKIERPYVHREEKSVMVTDTPLNEIQEKYAEKKKAAEERLKQLEQQKAVTEKRAARMNSQVTRVVHKQSSRSERLSPNKEKLVDAVVWSEILGPPRAKRPFRGRVK
jgi:Fe2+ transport system protein B